MQTLTLRNAFRMLIGRAPKFHDYGGTFPSSETQDAREAGARYSRGSIGIRHKAFLTTDDLRREGDEVAGIHFPKR